MARVVDGDENSSDTYRDFYRHTGMRLKAANVALWRLDNAGKDAAKGQRGSSAKVDDVDVVWFLERSKDGEITLTCTHSRLRWVRPKLIFRLESDPELLRHVLTPHEYAAGSLECIHALDELEVPVDATLATAIAVLRQHGQGRRREIVSDAMRYRKQRPDVLAEGTSL